MAKGGDKRRLEENRKHLQKLQLLIAVANVSNVEISTPGAAWDCHRDVAF